MEPHWHLCENDFFNTLPPEVEADFMELATYRKIRKKEFLFFEDDAGDSCFYLKSGAVRIFRFTAMGKEPIIFIRKAGEVFGMAEVIDNQPRKCNAQAVCDCELYAISKEKLEVLLQRHYPLARRVISILGRRVRYLGEQVENLMVGSVATRLLKILLYLSFEAIREGKLARPLDGGAIHVPIVLSQADFASLTGSCQQTISQTMKQLQDEGLIQMDKREIILLRPEEIISRLYE